MRRPSPLRALAATALAVFAFLAPGGGPSHAGLFSPEIVDAYYTDPTDRYPHGALGDDIENATLEVTLSTGARRAVTWPSTVVFEDTEPRLVDFDGDNKAEVLTVESHETQGSRVAIYGLRGEELRLVASTPFLGTRFRWIGISGAADLDGDGRVEIAAVDRPHINRVLRVWRFDPTDPTGRLDPVTASVGFTNHRFGDKTILGGIRTCNGVPEIITATPDWSRLQASRLIGDRLVTRVIGPNSPEAQVAARTCP